MMRTRRGFESSRWRRHTAALSLLGVALWVLPASAQGLRFAFEPASRFGASEPASVLTLRGEIMPGDAERFVRFVLERREQFVEHGARVAFVIDGGDVLEAMRIGELLRDAFVEAWLPDTGSTRCISACFLMFAHCVSRRAVAETVGLHRPYFEAQALAQAAPEAVRARYEALGAQLRSRMSELAVPGALVERMFSLPAGEVYRLSMQDLEALGRRQAWFEDYLAARCARPAMAQALPDSSTAACTERLLREQRRTFVERFAAGAR